MARFPPTLLLALFLVTGAMVLLWLITFSTPFLKVIFFLQNNRGDGNARFGVFGWCSPGYCLPPALGYNWDPQIPGGATLTRSLVLFPVSTGLATLAFFALAYTTFRLDHAIPSFILASLAFVASALSVFFSAGIFNTARFRFSRDGPKATYGPALWMSIAAMLALFLAVPLIVIGGLRERHYRTRRREVYEY